MMTLSKYLCNPSSVGNWHGQEQRASENINRIYRALDERLFHILVMGDEEHYHPDTYNALMSRVWNDWHTKPALLTLTPQAVEEYIQTLTASYTQPTESMPAQPGSGTGIHHL